LSNRRLLIFAGSAALFQVANASMMPLLGGSLAYEGKRQAAPLIAALIIVPQLLVGLLRALGWRVGRKTWSQAAAARWLRCPAHPRSAVFLDQ
jgi:hypothetical protein